MGSVSVPAGTNTYNQLRGSISNPPGSITLNGAFNILTDNYLYPGITYTLASGLTYFDSAGVLQTAAANVLPREYEPSTLAFKGYPFFEARTNSIRNNTMVGAVAGTPGTPPTNWFVGSALTGITAQLVGAGTSLGVNYVEYRLSGTPSAAGVYGFYFDTNTGIAATVGQTFTLSFFTSLVAGSTTGISGFKPSVDERTAVIYLSTQLGTNSTPTTAAITGQRRTFTFTMAQALAANAVPYLGLDLTGAAIDITLRIGLPQLELGSFATPPIRCSTVAVTRAAPSAVISGASFLSFWNALAGTIVCGFIRSFNDTVTVERMWSASDNTTNNRISGTIDASNATPRLLVTASGSGQANVLSGSAVTAGIMAKNAACWSANLFQSSTNGVSGTLDTAGTVPTVTQLAIANAPETGNTYLNGWISSLSYYGANLLSSINSLSTL